MSAQPSTWGHRSVLRRPLLIALLAAIGALALIAPARAAALSADFTCSPTCSVLTGTSVVFTATTDASKPNYSWDLNGDGQYGDAIGSTAKEQFTNAGDYTIGLRVLDGDTQQTVGVKHVITVSTPTVDFTCTPGCTVPAGTAITFMASGNAPQPSYSWDLQGRTPPAYVDADGPSVSRQFDQIGTFPISVEMTDGAGGQPATATQEVTVTKPSPPAPFNGATAWALQLAFNSGWMGAHDPAVPPVPGGKIDTRQPSVSPRVTPRRAVTGQLVAFDASRVRMALGHVYEWQWDTRGDGLFADGAGPRIRTSFSTPGRHVVRVRVIRTQGPDVVVSMSVRIMPRRSRSTARLVSAARPGPVATSFAHGLGGWRAFGDAFGVHRPAAILESALLNLPGTVGGSYADFYVPLGIPAHQYASSARADRNATGLVPRAGGDLATGVLTSPRFTISKRYLWFWLGGDERTSSPKKSLERVELWVGSSGRYRPITSLTELAGSSEFATRRVLDMRRYKGEQGVLVASDQSAAAHMSLGSVAVGNQAPAGTTMHGPRSFVPPPPVPGFADLHTHLMAHIGMGALQHDANPSSKADGIRTYMGVPGGNVADYSGPGGPSAYANDVWRTDFRDGEAHFGQHASVLGFTVSSAAAAVNVIDGNGFTMNALLPDHGPAYEQMHVTELFRAHEGGLNLMTALAVHNRALEYAMSTPYAQPGAGWFVHQTGDTETILATVAATQQLADLNSTWMQVVYTPQEARDAILHGKLAIVLGVEVDGLGSLVDIDPNDPSQPMFHTHAVGAPFDSPEQEVEWLYRLGIRQVIPIHSIDNSLGSTAVFNDLYNSQNELEHRPPGTSSEVSDLEANRTYLTGCWPTQGVDWLAVDDPAGRCPHTFGHFYSVDYHEACHTHLGVAGECVSYRLWVHQSMLDIQGDAGVIHANQYPGSRTISAPPLVGVTAYRGPCSAPTPPAAPGEVSRCDTAPNGGDPPNVAHGEDNSGMTNAGPGLTSRGQSYIAALERYGMLIDVEHMADSSRQLLMAPGSPLYRYAVKTLTTRRCPSGEIFHTATGEALCMHDVYPVLSSHTVFRAQSPVDDPEKAFLPNEQQRTPTEVEFIRRTGGLVAPVVLQPRRVPIGSGGTTPAAATGPTAAVTPDDYHLHSSPVVDDCPGSSTSFAAAYQYAIEKMGGRGVALGTDLAFVGGTSPRFDHLGGHATGEQTEMLPDQFNVGEDHSADPIPHQHVDPENYDAALPNNCREWRTIATDPFLTNDQKHREIDASFNFTHQRNPIVYAGPASEDFTTPMGFNPLGVLRAELRPGATSPSSFNATGLDTYGKLPDLLQDTVNVGVAPVDMAPLLHSAQDYIDMWTKTQRLANCHTDVCLSDPPPVGDDPRICRYTCPRDAGHGLDDDTFGVRRSTLDAPYGGFGYLPADG
jgi:microsomal dipeptidase-like Zn-dependent dipeptidase